MKVVFLQDVPGSGARGDVKEVADGYATNYLIRQQLALPATKENLNRIEAQKKSEEKKKAKAEAELDAQTKELDNKMVTLSAKVGKKGKLYGSITSADIAAELKKVHGIKLDKRKIELSEPINELGTFDVTAKLDKNHTPKLIVKVVPKEEA